MHWLFLMSSDWLFLLDSEWSIPPGSNKITCTIYFVRIFVTFVCIFCVLRHLNRLFQKYNLIFAVYASLHMPKRADDPNIVTQLFSALRRKIFLRVLIYFSSILSAWSRASSIFLQKFSLPTRSTNPAFSIARIGCSLTWDRIRVTPFFLQRS